MAVTKIRKMSSWTLLGVMLVSVIVFAMFYLGGVIDSAARSPNRSIHRSCSIGVMWYSALQLYFYCSSG